MAVIKFTLDEIEFAKAVNTMRQAIRGRGVRTIQCSLTKTHLKLQCPEWGSVRAAVKSENTSRFVITPRALGHAVGAYRDFKKGSSDEAYAVMDKKLGFFRTHRMDITIK
ncbi:hypothetical protein [Rubritalea profundi]|uniref:Uncharacterized protein n=1 Tax=Rubritalea profundi TaxID=1658618 RepID=A0A2S7TZ81_9BACT|nr:hypothetical protein [Rubritalea profundi]PQJ27434.1 hypothetical protein BSZ32_02270 [Rubritalea profundi]